MIGDYTLAAGHSLVIAPAVYYTFLAEETACYSPPDSADLNSGVGDKMPWTHLRYVALTFVAVEELVAVVGCKRASRDTVNYLEVPSSMLEEPADLRIPGALSRSHWASC